MTLPTTYLAALLLTLLAMICWGSWANTSKLTGKWRFEMFCVDFAIGALLAVTVLALTVGEVGRELSFRDNLLITGKRQLVAGTAAGVVYSLANMFLIAAISVAGMAVAFPISLGVALSTGIVWSYLAGAWGSPPLLFGGAAVLLAGAVVAALAHRKLAGMKDAEVAKAWTSKHRPPPKTGWKAVWLALASGLVMGAVPLLVNQAQATELGLRPYATAFTLGLGVFLGTPVYTVFFMNVPVEGKPIGPSFYLRGTLRQHLIGVLGGVVWAAGLVAYLAVEGAPQAPLIPETLRTAVIAASVLLATLWGLLYWKEFRGAPAGVSRLGLLVVGLLALGLGLISAAVR